MLFFNKFGFSNLATEFFTYNGVPIVVKIFSTNSEIVKKLPKEIFETLTNHIYNYSYENGSYISQITKKGYRRAVMINDDLRLMLGKIMYYHYLTKSISPTIGYIIDIWGFEKNSFYVPTPSEISNALKISSPRNLIFSNDFIILKNKQTKFYLVPFAIGLGLDKVKVILRKNGISNAFVSVGNSFSLALGSKENYGWTVGIMNPQNRLENEIFVTINISNLGIYTADISENAFVEGFKNYHSIINPRDGYPPQHNLLSVSVVDDSLLDATVLARSLFVMGKDAGMLFAEKNRIKALFITLEDGKTRVYKTSHWMKIFDRETTKKAK
ncbi:MAG: FAD:protein FMN transferase [Brevinematales bacterium]|nr:FAD:protein FMN transferase [Brevinematales bacterium]